MKLNFSGINFIKQESPHRVINTKKTGSKRAASIFTMTLLILMGSVAVFWGLKDVNAQVTQSESTFRVIVEVVNNGNLDEHGTIHVSMDGSRNPQVLNNQLFPAFQTSTFIFTFSSSEAPVGKGFVAEVIYGDDEFKRAYGTNTPAKTPEVVTITIP